MLALNWESYLALKLALDSRVLALVLVSRVQASASALKSPGLGLGLEGPGLGLVLGLLDFGLDYTTLMPGYVLPCNGVSYTVPMQSAVYVDRYSGTLNLLTHLRYYFLISYM